MYNWLVDLIGYINTGSQTTQNATIIQLAGFLVVMLFIICIDLLMNGLFGLFKRERRK